MRKLQAQDLMKAVTIAGKIGNDLKIDENMNSSQIGVAFFSSAMKYAETDLKEFLANIAEMTPKEFDKQDFEFPLDVIEKLAELQDLTAFLERVKALTGKLFKK